MNNFNNLERSWRAYGGLACRKDGVLYRGEPYLMKYPANLKHKELKGVNLSYANDTVNEYLGSHIFSALGMEAQETVLGIASDKIVVLCKDFAVDAELIEFNKIKTTSSRDLPGPEDGDSTDDRGKRIHPLRLIQSKEFPICTMALQDVLSRDCGDVFELIRACEYLSEIKKEFYCSTIELRWKKLREITF